MKENLTALPDSWDQAVEMQRTWDKEVQQPGSESWILAGEKNIINNILIRKELEIEIRSDPELGLKKRLTKLTELQCTAKKEHRLVLQLGWAIDLAKALRGEISGRRCGENGLRRLNRQLAVEAAAKNKAEPLGGRYW